MLKSYLLKSGCYIIVLLSLTGLLYSCKKEPEKKQITQQIQYLLHAFPSNPTIGIVIENLHNKHILYQDNIHRSFIPASTTKTLTATAALDFLGANYRFVTRLATTNKNIVNHTLNGNIYLQFSGDPSFKYKDLRTLLNTLKKIHIKKINGDLLITTGFFPKFKHGPGYMWDDFNFCFSAPSDAIVLNRNCFKFSMLPNSNIGKKTIITNKNLSLIPVNNLVTTEISDHKQCSLEISANSHNDYHLTGCIAQQSNRLNFDLAVRNPRLLLKNYIYQWLQQQHISLNGDIHYVEFKTPTYTLALHQAKPLYQLLRHMLKTSDNLYANNIFKTIGAIYLDQPASWQNGATAELAILKHLNIDTSEINLVDGAGLSRYNRFSPQVLLQILNYNYDHPEIGHYFYNSLSIAGVDDKLRPLALGQDTGTFRAKTGSMQAVAAIAGYLHTINGTPLAVIVMINGKEHSLTYFALIRNIIYSLANATF